MYHLFWSRSHSVALAKRYKLVLQEKGIETFQRSLPDGKVQQIFFFDPDGKLSLNCLGLFLNMAKCVFTPEQRRDYVEISFCNGQVMDWRLQVGFQRNKLGAQHSGGISYWTIKLQWKFGCRKLLATLVLYLFHQRLLKNMNWYLSMANVKYV